MFLAVFYNTYCLLCLFGSKEKSHRYQIVKGILKGHLEIAIVSVVEQLLSHWSKLITILILGLDSNVTMSKFMFLDLNILQLIIAIILFHLRPSTFK